jgi:flavin-dependent dehydrogenase
LFLEILLRNLKAEYNSGLIPVYNPKLKTQKKNVYLVGDAAGQVKASTYGGIISGMFAARELAKAIIEGKNYKKLWKKKLGKELKRHLSVRKRFDRFSNENYNYFIKLTKQNKVKNLLEKYDRDNLKKYAWKLFFIEPRFLKFVFM